MFLLYCKVYNIKEALMFNCPNCDEKIHWKYSLNIRLKSVISCASCAAKLTVLKGSYYKATFISLIFLLIFLWWILSVNQVFWAIVSLPVAIVIVTLVFYSQVKFESNNQQEMYS
jgi:uncharacterized protein (DUF983 family)